MRGVILAAMLLLASPADASAIYQWIGLGATPCCQGTIEISDTAASAGHASFSNSTFIYPATPYAPGDIIRFRFDAAEFGPSFITGQYTINLTSLGVGLSGSIDAFGLESTIRMQSNSDLWTIYFYRTDVPGRCYFPGEDCAGQTGRWALVSSQDVDEPPAALMLIGGVILLWAVRRARPLSNMKFNRAAMSR